MPSPRIFESRNELVRALQDPKTQDRAQNFFSNKMGRIDDVVRDAVGSNTFRAFRKLPVRPSDTFRNWSKAYIEKLIPKIRSVNDKAEFSKLIDASIRDLERVWQTETRSEMGYGRGAKLLNLVFKQLMCYDKLEETQRQLIRWLHVPLDRYSIVGLREVAKPDFKIPSNATMKFVTTQEQYNAFQDLIADIANEADVPPIYYDILVWNEPHSNNKIRAGESFIDSNMPLSCN